MTGGSTTGGSMTAGSMALRIDDRRINGLDIPPLSDVRVEMAVYTMQPMPPGQIQGREPHSLGSAAAGNCFL